MDSKRRSISVIGSGLSGMYIHKSIRQNRHMTSFSRKFQGAKGLDAGKSEDMMCCWDASWASVSRKWPQCRATYARGNCGKGRADWWGTKEWQFLRHWSFWINVSEWIIFQFLLHLQRRTMPLLVCVPASGIKHPKTKQFKRQGVCFWSQHAEQILIAGTWGS